MWEVGDERGGQDVIMWRADNAENLFLREKSAGQLSADQGPQHWKSMDKSLLGRLCMQKAKYLRNLGKQWLFI
jgi:hypothetical protein